MPRPCSVCLRPDRLEIEARLLRGEALRPVAVEVGLSHSALDRHRRNCQRSRSVEEARTHVGEVLIPGTSVSPTTAPHEPTVIDQLFAEVMSCRRSAVERMSLAEHLGYLAATHIIGGRDYRQVQTMLAVVRTIRQGISLDDVMAEAREKAGAEAQRVDATLLLLDRVLRGDMRADQFDSLVHIDDLDGE